MKIEIKNLTIDLSDDATKMITDNRITDPYENAIVKIKQFKNGGMGACQSIDICVTKVFEGTFIFGRKEGLGNLPIGPIKKKYIRYKGAEWFVVDMGLNDQGSPVYELVLPSQDIVGKYI